MRTPAEVVAEARRWVGTPWCHQGRTLGLGVDCAGLIEQVILGLGLPHDGAPVRDYPIVGNGAALEAECVRHLDVRAGDPQPGMVGLFHVRGRKIARHIGIFSDLRAGLGLIHAWNGRHCRAAVEHGYSPPWNGRMLVMYGLRGVVYR